MKKRVFGLLLAGLALCFCSGIVPVSGAEPSGGGKVTAYYFHGNFRCPTCNKMEQYAAGVIQNGFKEALASGKLEFRAVNVESKGNEHYVQDYQLYTKALVLSQVRDGKEVRAKNLDRIWELVHSKEQYEHYVRDEVAAFLKEA